jgi:hypothetical protein
MTSSNPLVAARAVAVRYSPHLRKSLLRGLDIPEQNKIVHSIACSMVLAGCTLPQSRRNFYTCGVLDTRAVMEQWGARGRGTRFEVMVNNEPCLKMCRKLGFSEGKPDERAYIELHWYPPDLAPERKNDAEKS